MKLYNVMYILEDEQEKRLSAVAERYGKINGWKEIDALQFAVLAFIRRDVERKLEFLEDKIEQMEREKKDLPK